MTEIEKLIADLTRMAATIRDNASREERPLKRKLMEAKARTVDDAATAIRAMQAETERLRGERDGYAKAWGEACSDAMKADARALDAEATVATLTAQVEAADQFFAAYQTRLGGEYGMPYDEKDLLKRYLATRAALSTENTESAATAVRLPER